MNTRRPNRRRRGVLLLIVLSLLILFVLIGITFIVVAGQYRQTALHESRHNRTGDAPRRIFDFTVYQLLRGAPDRQSILGRHSLLEDLYGRDGFRGLTEALTAQYGGQVLTIRVHVDPASITPALSLTNHYYAGSVLTFVDGPYAHESLRILDSQVVTGTDAIDLACDGSTLKLTGTNPLPLVSRVVVNGKAFNGAGATLVDERPYGGSQYSLSSFQYLHPNFRAYYHEHELELFTNASPLGAPYLGKTPFDPDIQVGNSLNLALYGGDESWDAADPLNMHMSFLTPNDAIGRYYPLSIGYGPLANPNLGIIIPSFHRPWLVNYLRDQWFSSVGVDPENQDWSGATSVMEILEHELHLSVLRPLPGPSDDDDENVHPNFTGSNPAATWNNADSDEANLKRLTEFLIYGPWDVDNDGDLVPDSIWLDIGLPPQRTLDGVLYKPLVAVLLRDLDGRINVNTAGIVTDNTQSFGPEFAAIMAGTPTNPVDYNRIPYGSGYGPAEIGQSWVLPASAGITEKQIIDSRNADQTLPPSLNPTVLQPPGLPGEDRIVSPAWEQATNWEYNAIPLNHADINQQVHGYLSPPDLLGKGRLFMDHAGQPFPALMGGLNEKYDDPYEANLIDDPWTDSLFTDREMEAVLRGTEVFSPDSNARTLALVSNPLEWARLRHHITTRSFDIPIPNQQVPDEFRNLTYPALPDPNARLVRSLVDLYYARLATIGGLAGPAIDLQIQQMFPFEMLRGGKFNINRPFGNGRDDDAPGELGYGVADEPDEKKATAPLANHATNGLLSIDGTTIVSERQIFARQLYCLMLMLTREDYRAPEFSTESAQAQLELTRRQLAQWAINVVDFRDPDAIMTPFEYDANPYNGWDVDDNPETIDSVPDYRLVWGQEYSELMLTEAVAFHDRRVRDTDIDDGVDPRDPADMTTPFTRFREPARDGLDPDDPTVINDDDLDQVAMPQGSLFLEFYCPRSPIAGATTLPRELYSIVNDASNGIFNEPHLDLGRLAPANVRGVRAPVWRVAISEMNSTEFQTHQTHLDKRYPITSFDSPTDPKEMIWDLSVANSAPNRITLERFVWFTPYDPTTSGPADVLTLAGKNDTEVYFNHNGSLNPQPSGAGPNVVIQSNVLLKPNRYCVVGPRMRTDVGATSPGFDDGGNPTAAGTYYPGDQRFVFAGGLFAGGFNANAQQVTPVDATNASIPAGDVLGITVGAHVPSSWIGTPPAATQSVGLSVSEPLPQSGQYYDQPPATPVFANLPEAYGDPTKARAVSLNSVPDTPFDGQPNTPLEGITQTGTFVTNFRIAFLQRLANPLKPWNPVPNSADAEAWNPYITVDWLPIDLTVFNGMEDNDRQIRVKGQDEWIDPADPNPFATAPDEAFESREKGDPANGFQYVLFTGVAMPPRPTPRGGGGEFFNVNMNHTLGFLNRVDDPGGMPWYAKNPYDASNPPGSPLLMKILGHYAASPVEPFPWYTWNNRPFVSHMELLQVPKTPSATAYLQFSPAMGQESRQNNNPVEGPARNDSLGTFTHLLNFQHSRTPGSAATPNGNNYPDFSRLLDYVEVPSPYAGTRKWFNPANHDPTTAGVGYQNPFAYVSRFRDPGKVNLNTVYEFPVWQGLTFRHPESVGKWMAFQESRYGFDPVRNIPTLFGNPFRSSASAELMPVIRDPQNPANVLLDMRKHSADVSLLRRVGGSSNVGVFEPTQTHTDRYVDPDRSSHFHYEGVQRLGNLTTTHSNVYACWITVGYFELEQARDQTGLRVGEYNRLGQEVGADTGDIKRHRAFFMIDRSIPVGFEVGQNHNVDKCIVLRRYLEQQ